MRPSTSITRCSSRNGNTTWRCWARCCSHWDLGRTPVAGRGGTRRGFPATGGWASAPAQPSSSRRISRNPGVRFIDADIADFEFPEGRRFDLAGNFRSAYSCLNGERAIRALTEKLIGWTAPGGAIYMELTVPELLEEFNDSDFAAETGTRVSLRSPDGVHWGYHDTGGVHQMMSPSLEFFTGLITPHFARTSHAVVVRSIRRFVAWVKRPD